MNGKYVIVQSVFNFMKKSSDVFCLNDIQDNLSDSNFLSQLDNFRKNKKWITYDRKCLLIKDIDDNHLINIIGHLSKTRCSRLDFEFMIIHEFFNRGLKSEDLFKFQIPHMNSNGKKVLMSYKDEDFCSVYEVI